MKKAWSGKGFCFICGLLLWLGSPVVSAQIYKWVDADGNVHFSDKPITQEQKSSAETVELKQGYTPTEVTSEEQRARHTQQRADRARRKALEKQQEEQLAARNEALQEQCERDRRKLRAVTEVEVNDKGDRSIYYLTDDEGNALSVAQQKVAIEALREKIRKNC